MLDVSAGHDGHIDQMGIDVMRIVEDGLRLGVEVSETHSSEFVGDLAASVLATAHRIVSEQGLEFAHALAMASFEIGEWTTEAFGVSPDIPAFQESITLAAHAHDLGNAVLPMAA